MGRPVSIHDAAILDAARRVFLRHGYQVTTDRIARAARVSEGSIFQRYHTKKRLFLAAMDAAPVPMEWHARLLRSADAGDMRAGLEYAGAQVLQRLRVVFPRIMMIHSSGIDLRASRSGACGLPPALYHLDLLTKYFRAVAKAGRLQMRSPAVQAQLFIGAIAYYVFCERAFRYRPAPAAAYIRSVVEIVLRAGAPPSGKRERPTTQPAVRPPRAPSGRTHGKDT